MKKYTIQMLDGEESVTLEADEFRVSAGQNLLVFRTGNQDTAAFTRWLHVQSAESAVTTRTVKVILEADTSQFVSAIDAAKTRAEGFGAGSGEK